MRFLDLDLDFFLNQDTYRSECDGERQGSEYKPWSISEVRYFLEHRCGLSTRTPVQGRTIESHDRVLDFWHMLIKSGRLNIPFEVVHIDAHPDLWVGNGLYLKSDFLIVNSKNGLAKIKEHYVHPGNFLTFAIAEGWISSLTWIPRLKYLKDLPKWPGSARASPLQPGKDKSESPPMPDSPSEEMERSARFAILPWHRFKTGEAFDYIALSRSPDFTPPESDRLITIIEEYIKQI